MTCGIYEIINIKNGKKYIGQSINIEDRWQKHQQTLKTQKHSNDYLQKAWNKYGKDSFIFKIIEKCSREELNEKELFWIKEEDTYNNGYNLDKGGAGVLKYPEVYYRVIKKGADKGHKRYQIIKDNYSKPILTTIYKDEIYKLCKMLNDGQITENDAKHHIHQYSNTQSIAQLRNLGINYLITQSSKGYTQTDIRKLHNIPQTAMQKFLQEKNTTWKEIYTQGEQLKIQRFDKEHNIQQRVINGATNKEIKNEIGCSLKSLQQYKKQHNIRKPRNSKNTHVSKTNTGVQYLSLLKNYTWQYRRTYQNPNNITRTKFEDIERIIKEKGYLWIVYDEEKLKKAQKKSKLHNEIMENKKIGKKIHKNRKYQAHKQKFAKKRALKAFRKMFFTPQKKKQKSSTGITGLSFSKGDNAWIFQKKEDKYKIKRKKLQDLQNEVQKHYKWIIEDEILFQKVKKEVDIYQKERKKPFLERKKDFQFI